MTDGQSEPLPPGWKEDLKSFFGMWILAQTMKPDEPGGTASFDVVREDGQWVLRKVHKAAE